MMSASIILATIAAVHAISGGAAEDASPKVVSTVPARGATIEPGRVKLSVTFDRAMRPKSYSFVRKSLETYPQCGNNQPAQSADGRTFTLMCEVQANRQYEVWFNDPPYRNFVAENGVPAASYGLSFRTGSRPTRH